ncbi:hypothetical protein DL240_05335 [Lujinxingia litoralis]|uniref:Uncharacterized protein n=1 Tax=Lujinxingia litoralis TaxID=2211119 RepID=A0A328C6W8_9DELT|nr:hypothetical protein DL240_05335 [Lujinxingia litoralis]
MTETPRWHRRSDGAGGRTRRRQRRPLNRRCRRHHRLRAERSPRSPCTVGRPQQSQGLAWRRVPGRAGSRLRRVLSEHGRG